jgi:hypothetical protein
MSRRRSAFLEPVAVVALPPNETSHRTVARSCTLGLAAGAALCAALLAAAPAAGAGSRSADVPSPAAIALAKRKCSACHAVPPPGSRRNGWAHASMSMHLRRVALPAAEWALVREYLGVPPDTK